jgi:hypothetical protein
MIFDHKQQKYAIGIKNMQANHLKTCKAKGASGFIEFNDYLKKGIITHESWNWGR